MRQGIGMRAGAAGHPALLHWAGLGLLLAAACQGGLCPAGAAGDWPALAEGDIPFYADGAVLLDEQGREETWIYLAVPQEEVTCVEVPGQEGAWMQVSAKLRFLNADGSPLASMATDLDVPCVELDPQSAFSRRTISLQVPELRGPGLVEVQLEDRNANRVGLLNELRNVPRHGIARGHVPLPVRRTDRSAAGPILLWSLGEVVRLTRSDRFLFAPVEAMRPAIDPNPGHSYGLFQPDLTLYAELYGFQGRDVDLALRVLREEDGGLLLEESGRIHSRWDRCGVARRLDVTQLASGAYRFELQVAQADAAAPETGEGPMTLTGGFQVHWSPESWIRPREERMEEASLLMDPARWEQFLSLGAGQQEVVLDSIWSQRGGGSERTTSELKAVFRDRIQRADSRFRGLKRGSLTDRGRVYVNFGEPDEIHKELAPQEEDLIYYFLRREIDETEAGEAGGRPRRHPMDTSPYQVWYYIHWGHPLFPGLQARSRGGSGGLRFIFVDETGTGDYRLIYTNLFGGFD